MRAVVKLVWVAQVLSVPSSEKHSSRCHLRFSLIRSAGVLLWVYPSSINNNLAFAFDAAKVDRGWLGLPVKRADWFGLHVFLWLACNRL